MKNALSKLGLFFIFFDNMYLPINLGFDFKLIYIFMIIFIAYAMSIVGTIKIRKEDIQIITLLLLILGINLITNLANIAFFIKQSIGISVSFIYSFLLISVYKFDFKKIIKDYILIVILATIIGLSQFFFSNINKNHWGDLSFLGFDQGNREFLKPPYRIHAWFMEPSFFVYAITPILFIAMARLFNITKIISKFLAILIIIAVILSKSAIGFLGIFAVLGLIILAKYSFVKNPAVLFGASIFILLISIVIYQIPKVKERIDDSLSLVISDRVTSKQIDNLNLSSYALYSNYKVTVEAFKENPILGSGLGSYEKQYDKYINNVMPPNTFTENKITLNRGEANSFFQRFLSETGLVGIAFYLWFIFHYKIKYPKNFLENKDLVLLWCFNNGLFVLFILRLLRNGHYLHLGIEFMWIMYYLTYLKFKKEQKIAIENKENQTLLE
ncbi:O-antigen ligase family protein [Aureivirga marina]|uniref:O-antigen ligase family protein n=1 Tax=Aureivirga marina TaxID=1182451 RepID=UPI0018C9DFCE|nr:O-antigen ligase family protein [Aureivirga marina]